MSLKVVIPKGRASYYLRGTVTVGRKSRSVYETTGIRVGQAGAKALTQEIRLTREVQIRDELLRGAPATKTWLDLAVKYCEKRQAKRVTRDPSLKDSPDPEAWFVLRLTNFFVSRGVADLPLRELPHDEVDSFFATALDGAKLSYKTRLKNVYCAMMNFARKRMWIDYEYPVPDLPEYDILKQPVNKALEDEDVQLFISLAPEHAHPFVASVFGTGLRGGELIFIKRTRPDYTDRHGTGLCLDEGQEHFFLGMTKDGTAHIRTLPDSLVALLKSYLATRKDSYDALFLTNRGVPYVRPKRKRSSVYKTMWRNLAKRVARTLEMRAEEAELRGDPGLAQRLRDRAAQCRKVTGHWGRHNMVSRAIVLGKSDREIMQLTGHKTARMLTRYSHLKVGPRKILANSVDFAMEAKPEEHPVALTKKS
jgi:integrase